MGGPISPASSAQGRERGAQFTIQDCSMFLVHSDAILADESRAQCRKLDLDHCCGGMTLQ